MYESLHNHTTLSDGKLTHRELFDRAESLDIGVLAFTDHDALPEPDVMTQLESWRTRKAKWIVGIEISAALPHELGGEAVSNLHIIGLFVNPEDAALRLHCRKAQEARLKRMRVMVANLQALGFMLTEADCLRASGGESVGRPHVVEALGYHTENKAVIERLRAEMEETGHYDPNVAKKYQEMKEKGERQYPYTLFLSPDAFKPAYAEHEYMPDMDEAVALIRNAGGVALLAHYCYIRPKFPIEFLETCLRTDRIDGVEVVYGLGNYGTSKEAEVDQERKLLREMTTRHGRILGGGADAHLPEDLNYYVESGAFVADSIGLTKAMLASKRVNMRFSSLSSTISE